MKGVRTARVELGRRCRWRLPSAGLGVVLLATLACGEEATWQAPPESGAPAAPLETRDSLSVEGPSRILGWKVFREEPDHLLIDIDYVVTGAEGTGIMVSASSMQGRYAAPYRVWPELATVGHHTARVRLGAQEDRMPFTSDALRFTLYPGGGSVFAELVVPHTKLWSASRGEAGNQD